jgi:hypothetical protein
LCAIGSGGLGIPDITIGNNTVTFIQNGHTYTVCGYNAIPGYDMTSSFGGIDAAKLIAQFTK